MRFPEPSACSALHSELIPGLGPSSEAQFLLDFFSQIVNNALRKRPIE